jgi:radical SAM-linked protein
MSLLEAVFSRGDMRVSEMIEKAWSAGCRLDAWTEAFDFRKWLAAAESAGIDIHGYAERRFDRNDTLPWDSMDIGVKREFLWKELQKAHSCEITTDCRKLCSGCGLGCRESDGLRITGNGLRHGEGDSSLVTRHSAPVTRSVRIRFQFSKTGDLRFLSHREVMTAVVRAVRRAEIPVLYSQGFHPSPRISFGPPLNVGVRGLKEYFDMEVRPGHRMLEIGGDLDGHLSEGLSIHDARFIPTDEPSLQSFISRYEYEIICPDARVTEDFIREPSVLVTRGNAPGDGGSVDIRELVEDAAIADEHTVRLIVKDSGEKKVRLGEIVSAVFHLPVEELDVTRLRMFGWRNGWVEPLCNDDFVKVGKDIATETEILNSNS